MSNEKKQTVLESIYAFDAAPIMFESIMNEGDVQYGVQDYQEDLITTPEGDEVVDPSSLMDVNVNAPVQSGPQFNNEVEPMTDEDKRFFVDEFAKQIMNLHKTEITDDDVEAVGVYLQMATGTRQNIPEFLQNEIDSAEQRLSGQNQNEVLTQGVSADMTGDGMISQDDIGDDENVGITDDIDLGDGGLKEIEPTTTFLTPNEDDGSDMGAVGMEETPDFGLGEENAEPEALAEPVEGDTEGENSNPFADMEIDENESTEGGDAETLGDEPEGEPGAEPEGEPEGEPEAEPVAESNEDDEIADDILGDADEESSDDIFTESVNESKTSYKDIYNAQMESIQATISKYNKYHKVKAQCESIVAKANAAMNRAVVLESMNQSNKVREVKARCESIVNAYKKATQKESSTKAKLEAIVNKYRETKNAEQTLKARCEAIVSDAITKEKAKNTLKAKCESIVNAYKAKSGTSSRVNDIIAKYKASV